MNTVLKFPTAYTPPVTPGDSVLELWEANRQPRYPITVWVKELRRGDYVDYEAANDWAQFFCDLLGRDRLSVRHLELIVGRGFVVERR